MDVNSQSQQPISDDQELAKVLAGVSQQADDTVDPDVENTILQPVAGEAAPVDVAPEAMPTMPEPTVPPAVNADLDGIKQEALGELRPLVDKLNVAPEEKFDTYLLLLRSTDDKSLIAPAHEAAKNIVDEARRAQALLDIIKEIDFFSQPQQ